MKNKYCTKCNRKRLLNQFHRNKGTRDGRQHRCIECRQYRDYVYYRRPEIKKRIQQQRYEYRQRIKRAAFERLGGCRCITFGCGCTEFNWLTISHENNDGKTHRAKTGETARLYCWILKTPNKDLKQANLAVRCQQCNFQLAFYDEKELKASLRREHKRIRGKT